MIYLTAIICGLLGSYAGADGTTKAWRRVGIPLVVCVALCLNIGLYGLFALPLFAPLCLGHGRYSPDDDKISFLGSIALKISPYNPFVQDIIIRSIVSILCSLSVIGLAICTGNWAKYGLCALFMLCVDVWFGAFQENEGMFRLFGKDLLVEEAIRYASLGAMVYLIAV